MLARRFSIVCLITALFGMSLAELVARTDHPLRGTPFEAGCKLSYHTDC